MLHILLRWEHKLFKQPNTQRTFKGTEHHKGTNIKKKTWKYLWDFFLKIYLIRNNTLFYVFVFWG